MEVRFSQGDLVNRVVFEISAGSSLPGFASNRSNLNVVDDGQRKDYSFNQFGDGPAGGMTITRTSVEMDTGPAGIYGGKMEATKTWLNFYCKDYGGWAQVHATIYYEDGSSAAQFIDVPLDTDGDNIADKWEIEMGKRWSKQCGLTPMTDVQALNRFNSDNTNDGELKDPDLAGTTPDGPLREQAEEGDAHTVMEEYRGYILDGGGLDGNGANGPPGGHIRLDPARKEVLLEVDRAAVLNNVPAVGLPAILNDAAKIMSWTGRGDGIYLYWLMDDTGLDLPKADVDTREKQVDKLADTRNATLKSDFLHVLFFDEGNNAAFDATAGAYPSGIVIATTDLNAGFPAANFPKRNDLFSTTVAHEVTHALIPQGIGAPFDAKGHVADPNGDMVEGDAEDRTELMYAGTTLTNSELITVKIFPTVQAVLATKSTLRLDQ